MRELSFVEGSLKEQSTSNPFCISCFSARYQETETGATGAINVSCLASDQDNILIKGVNVDQESFEESFKASEEDIQDFSNEKGINPQKVIAYLFRIASDLLAPDPKNPN